MSLAMDLASENQEHHDQQVLVEAHTTNSGHVRVITLSRPRALNAISRAMAKQLFLELRKAEQCSDIKVIVLTGAGRAFSAGADVKELMILDVQSAFKEQWLADWNREFMACRKPILAAVNGFALGGGCELAMMCDIVYCADSAEFGLPEIMLGTIPGAGGTQRMLRAVGKSRATELILTGDRMSSREALERGLVANIFDGDDLLPSVLKIAEKIAGKGSVTTQMAKEALQAAENIFLHDGLVHERNLYYMSFNTADFKEGTSAFAGKRSPNFV